LAAAGRKFSGNAQQRKRTHLLHHGTLLHDFDLDHMGHYLRMPSRQPAYRGHRDHRAFLTNLPLDAATLKSRLRTRWEADTDSPALPQESVRQLVEEKYSRVEWVRRR
jgi:lipoate-protein ligase A